jgi:hypothetical protein
MKKGGSMKLTPFCLKSFAVTTFTEREHQAIELVDHTHLPVDGYCNIEQ